MKLSIDTLNVYTYICIKLIMMKLEEEIKQSNFKSEKAKLLINLVFTGNWISSKTSELLKPFGITWQQFNVLRILRGQHPNPATVNLIIDRMLDKMSNVSRLIDKLLVKKLVVRSLRGEDRRCVDILITPKGMKLLEDIDKVQSEWEKKVSKMSTRECKELNDLLDKFRN